MNEFGYFQKMRMNYRRVQPVSHFLRTSFAFKLWVVWTVVLKARARNSKNGKKKYNSNRTKSVKKTYFTVDIQAIWWKCWIFFSSDASLIDIFMTVLSAYIKPLFGICEEKNNSFTEAIFLGWNFLHFSIIFVLAKPVENFCSRHISREKKIRNPYFSIYSVQVQQLTEGNYGCY